MVKEFGKLPKEVFSSFEETPIASASIGQAHRATLPDGTQVVVKVQHANIEQVAQVDLRIIQRLTKIIAFFFDIKGMDYLYTQVRKMIEEELDFRREAQSMQQIAANLQGEQRFLIPQIHPAYCTGRVLTTTWHEGVKISNTAQLDAWGLDRRDILTRLLRAYCQMVFKDGVYHADPHPGNILVKPDGTLVLLDFGAVAELSPQLREGIPQMIEAAVKNDTDALVAAARRMGFIAHGKDADEMAEKMIDALRNFLQNEVKLEGLNFRDIELDPLNNSLFDLIGDIGIGGITGTVQVPKDWVLLNRMIALLLGISTTLDPQLNPLDVVRPYLREYMVGEKDNLVAFVTGLVRRTVATSLALPDELHRVLQKIDKGQLETRTPDIREGSRLLYQGFQQFVLALLIIAAATFGYLFYTNGHPQAARWSFGTCAFFIFLLLRAIRVGGRIWRRLE
jgi:predicted unusual protein kinase regulating ubiquinone biosynthesis (AarF/ABC1/UbiB family)